MAPARKTRRRGYRSPLSVPQILAWADQYHKKTGRWPTILSGPIPGKPDETWRKVDNALRLGLRNLPGKSSLARLLAKERGVRNPKALPRLTFNQILAWADAHHRRTGEWPRETSGAIPEAPGERWHAIDRALRAGVRGLPGATSLAMLLAERRGVRNIQRLPRLTPKVILAWADEHRRRTGKWPNTVTGAVHGAPGETWSGIDTALKLGRRGLPGGSTLLQLLAEKRGVRNPRRLPPLTHDQIIRWARAHRDRTGRWPTRESGPVVDAVGETWSIIDRALKSGGRSLPGGESLFRLIRKQKAKR
jgi:hypothetical protein